MTISMTEVPIIEDLLVSMQNEVDFNLFKPTKEDLEGKREDSDLNSTRRREQHNFYIPLAQNHLHFWNQKTIQRVIKTNFHIHTR